MCKENNSGCLACSNYRKLSPSVLFKTEKFQYEPETCGIMAQHYLKGLFFEIAEVIECPVIILQKIPEECNCDVFAEKKDNCELCENNRANCPHDFCEKLTMKEKYARIEMINVYFENFSPLCRIMRSQNDPGQYNKGVNSERKGKYKHSYNLCRCHNLDSWAAEYFLGDKEKAKNELEQLTEETTNDGKKYIRYVCP